MSLWLKIKEKREARAKLFNDAVKLREDGEAAGGLSAEQEQRHSQMLDDVDRMKGDITRLERELEVGEEMGQRRVSADDAHGRQDRSAANGEPDGDQRPGYVRHERVENLRQFLRSSGFNDIADSLIGELNLTRSRDEEYRDAVADYVRNGFGEMEQRNRDFVRNVSDPVLRALDTTAGSGVLVPDEDTRQIIEIMEDYGGVRPDATVLPATQTGGNIPIPVMDDTANKARIVGENAANSSVTGTIADPSVTNKNLGAFTYRSEIKIPVELTQDAVSGFMPFVNNQMGIRFERAQGEHFTVGTGSGQPRGFLLDAGDSGFTTASATSVTWENLVDLEFSIDKFYRRRGRYHFASDILRTLKKMKDNDGRPLWTPGTAVAEPDTINGRRYTENPNMPTGAGAKGVAFGDFSYYYIRDVRGMNMVRLNERYADNLQIGILGFMRSDGILTNPAALKYLTLGA